MFVFNLTSTVLITLNIQDICSEISFFFPQHDLKATKECSLDQVRL